MAAKKYSKKQMRSIKRLPRKSNKIPYKNPRKTVKKKVYKQPSQVSGATIEDVLNISLNKFNKLTKKELQKILGRLVSASNKRLRTFEKHKRESPAYKFAMDSGGKFSTKGKSIDELRKEFMRAKGFLESKTGSYKRFLEVQNKVINQLQEKGINMDKNKYDKFWRAYEEAKKIDPSITERKLKYMVLEELADIVDLNKDVGDIAQELTKRIKDIYEQTQGDVDGLGEDLLSGENK